MKPNRVHVEILSLKESAEERRRFIGDAHDFVCCLPIELEVELSLGSTVVPVGENFELAPPQASFRERSASDGDANARRLPGDSALLWNRFRRGDDAARDEASPALILTREDEDRVAFGDLLATIHCLLRCERKRLRPRVANLGFDRKHCAFHTHCSFHGAWPNESGFINWLACALGARARRPPIAAPRN